MNFCVGAYYLFFYFRMRHLKEHLPFALLCLSVGLYDIFSAGLYSAHSLENGVFWQRLQFMCAAVISIFLIWFTSVFTEQKSNRIIRSFIVWFATILLVSVFVSPQYSLSSATPAVKDIKVFSLFAVTYYESEVGIFHQLQLVSSVLAYLYLFSLIIRYYRRVQQKNILLILFSLAVYFLGVANDSAVAMRLYQFIYISEYAFFFIVVAMAYVLLDKFVGIHAAFEELTESLEIKVEERTREIVEAQASIKTLTGLIPICANCKKIRDDRGYWEHLEAYIQSHSEAKFSHGVCPECAAKLYPGLDPSAFDY